jgi:hypothetical protein
VFGIAGWKNEFKDWKGSGVLCGISCLINGEWLTKWDGAEETNMEATKGGLSDAMKRAGYQWGIGRYLYSIPQTWVALKNEKYLAETPKLPGWALPEGFSYGKPPKNESDQFWMGEHKVSDPLPNNATQQDALKPLENKEDPILKCSSCGDAITTKVLDYSKQKFGKALCMKCQNEAKKVGAK